MPSDSSFSDEEEKDVEFGMLPDRKEPLTLPPAPAAAGLVDFGARFFPPETWESPWPLRELEAPVSLAPTTPLPAPQDVIVEDLGALPTDALYDPYKLFEESDRAWLSTLLNNELDGSGGFSVRVVALPPGAKVAPSLDPASLMRQWFGGRPGMIALYPVGRPAEAQAFFTPEVYQSYGFEALRGLVTSSSADAQILDDPVSQLTRFSTMAGLRLDHLAATKVPQTSRTAATQKSGRSILWWACAIGGNLAALTAGALWWKRRQSQPRRPKRGDSQPVILADVPIVPRLGGEFSGGCCATVSFGGGTSSVRHDSKKLARQR
jgi:hypothetical protein